MMPSYTYLLSVLSKTEAGSSNESSALMTAINSARLLVVLRSPPPLSWRLSDHLGA